jgi:hypothetical protein
MQIILSIRKRLGLDEKVIELEKKNLQTVLLFTRFF